ncbi:MAG: hypothetical protein ACTSX6_00155 [Candidatus Heimdallarchaeaceae archaeon]
MPLNELVAFRKIKAFCNRGSKFKATSQENAYTQFFDTFCFKGVSLYKQKQAKVWQNYQAGSFFDCLNSAKKAKAKWVSMLMKPIEGKVAFAFVQIMG